MKWIKCFYPEANSCVINAGNMTDIFNVARDIRPGCHLSPYLFIVWIEILSATVLKNRDVTGIKINEKEFKSKTWMIRHSHSQSFQALFNILDEFKQCNIRFEA